MMIIFLVFFLKVLAEIKAEAPLINLPDGQIKGSLNYTIKDNLTYFAYRGIPFAKKPINELRFSAPVKNDPWTGILDATKDSQVCTQIYSETYVPTEEISVVGSEDCLYINVYTTNISANLPVMVWVYGGSWNFGGSVYSIYPPDYLIEKDVIFISFNYRLGVFGFLSTEDSEAPGNWGLKDQILALNWVKSNIKKFGGNPDKVTLFGESSGAASVAYLVQSSLTNGLFNRAIMESGTSLSPWTLTTKARSNAFLLGLKLGIITLNSTTLLEQLRNIDATTLKWAETNLTTTLLKVNNILEGLPFAVVNEAEAPQAAFSGKSWQKLKEGDFQQVPLIMGFNSNEGGGLDDFYNPLFYDYQTFPNILPPYDMTANLDKRTEAGISIRHRYFGDSVPVTLSEATKSKFFGIDQYNRPIREFVNLASNYTNVYYYRFSYEGYLGNPNDTIKGVQHAEELRYLYAYTDVKPTAEDSVIIDRMTSLWTNFAKTGNPTPTSRENGAIPIKNLNWEPNNAQSNVRSSIKYLNIGANFTTATNPFQDDWEYYMKLYKQYGEPPYTTY